MAASTFAEVSLGDIADFRNGKAISPEKYTPIGKHPVFGSNGQIARSDEVLYPHPAIVIGRVGAYCGCVHYVPKASWITDNAIVALPKDGNDIRYLFYLLGSLELQRTAIGSAQPLMTQGGLKVVRAKAPPLAEQKAIAAILGALDDKIELNRRINATLELMARALFQSWFVDFDPVRAKLDGCQPAGLDKATAALFPSHFDHETDGVLPKGWNRKRWGDIATLEYGKSLRDYRESGGKYRVFGTNGPIGSHDEALCNSAGIIIGRKGAYRGVHYSPDPFFVIDTAFFLKPRAMLDLKWAYYELLRFDINNMDSGSAIPSTSRDDFYGIPVIVPPQDIQGAFGEIVGVWFAKAFSNDQESRVLGALRDTLLPKLLNGECSVADASNISRTLRDRERPIVQ